MKSKDLVPAQSERLHMRISPEEITAIDDWRFANRIPSRSEAVRRLVQIGTRIESGLQPVVNIISSQMDRYAEFDRLMDSAANYEGGVQLDNEKNELEIAKFIVDLLDWQIEATREAIELHHQMNSLVIQNNALGEIPDFDDAIRLANNARAEGERRRALWKARLEQMKKSKND